MADACFQIAYIEFSLGNYPHTLESVTNGLVITDDPASGKNNWRITIFSGDSDAYKARLFIAADFHQLFAFLYQTADNKAKAIEEFNKAISLVRRVDNKAELSLDYMSLGGIYGDMGQTDSALLIQHNARWYAIASS